MPKRNELASWADLEVLPTFSACIKETLRISSLITERLGLVEPEEVLIYREFEIPPGTAITMSLCDLHNDPAAFLHPALFKPERWIEAKKAGVNLEKHFAPFSRGSRGCLGQK